MLHEQADVWKEAEGVARARYAVGQGAQQDVLRAQLEITRFEQLRAEQEADIESRLAELSRLVGREVPRDAVERRPPRPAARAARPRRAAGPGRGRLFPSCAREPPASSASGSRSSWRSATSSPTSPCRPAT